MLFIMKALKCKTLGASVMYIVIYTYIIHGNMHTRTPDKCVSVRGSIRKFGKDKSSSSLLPTLRGISGTA